MNGVMKKIEEGAAANLERAKRERVEERAPRRRRRRRSTLGDTLAESASELPPARSTRAGSRGEGG